VHPQRSSLVLAWEFALAGLKSATQGDLMGPIVLRSGWLRVLPGLGQSAPDGSDPVGGCIPDPRPRMPLRLRDGDVGHLQHRGQLRIVGRQT